MPGLRLAVRPSLLLRYGQIPALEKQLDEAVAHSGAASDGEVMLKEEVGPDDVADDVAGLQVIDVSDPSSPWLVAARKTLGAYGVEGGDGAGCRGLHVLGIGRENGWDVSCRRT